MRRRERDGKALGEDDWDIGPTDEKGRYLHWDDLRFKPAPNGLDPRTYWALTRMSRHAQRKKTPFLDTRGQTFSYTPTDALLRRLHEFDSEAHGGVQFAGAAPDDQTTQRFLVKSLIEEPFNSSLLEGAATTRDIAKRLVRDNQPPKTEDERMVLNNYRAIEFIKARRSDPLTPELVHELHRILVDGTSLGAGKIGRFRSRVDDINVVDETTGEILHRPPDADELPARMERLCAFANDAGDGAFTHPIVRAIVLHFMLAYDHPYADGNGRTARALFYWSVVKDGYWLLEYVSISRIINKAPIRYGQAFLQVETDGADLTYFVLHQAEAIREAMDELGAFIRKKRDELGALDAALADDALRGALNHRQLAVLHDAVRSPAARYLVGDHQQMHRISYLTARADLEGLVVAGFLRKTRRGNRSIYAPAPDLPRMLPSKGAPSR